MTDAASLCGFTLRSARPAALADWYREALDLDGEGAVPVRFEPDTSLPPRAREPVRLMPNLVVDDASAVERHLIGLGVTWIRELESTSWGRIATLLDPDGNYVQLFELPAPAPEVGP